MGNYRAGSMLLQDQYVHVSHCRSVLAQIDQGEFEGFEYINPLLISKVDYV